MCGGTANDSEASLSALEYSIDQLELLVVFKGDGHIEVRWSNLREGGDMPLCIAGGVVGHRFDISGQRRERGSHTHVAVHCVVFPEAQVGLGRPVYNGLLHQKVEWGLWPFGLPRFASGPKWGMSGKWRAREPS